MTNNLSRPLILASQSPRRSQLLREAGFQFSVHALEIDESFPPEMPVEEVAPWLAQRKARAAAHLIQDQEVVLAADSVVILDGTIYNKPADYTDAFRMIRLLSGRQHTVITGVCLLAKEKEKVLAGVTKVWFAELDDEEIDYYIHTCKPYDKAGAYGAQDWIGHCKITRIEGTFQNVMGLPVDLVYKALGEFK
ncbi:MAG: septum formation protein Maf [Haliscomenobacteraceae bacterium CHB4]|nr:Septum formation protein Maf [Saprospiraceae bacterium]MCE7921964.1 septum formation protein Maf [Haliscomenobacteraceae bacterium CHB4]